MTMMLFDQQHQQLNCVSTNTSSCQSQRPRSDLSNLAYLFFVEQACANYGMQLPRDLFLCTGTCSRMTASITDCTVTPRLSNKDEYIDLIGLGYIGNIYGTTKQ